MDAKEIFKEKLQKLGQVLNILRDKTEIAQKFAMFFQPKDIRTASRLSAPQVEFMADCVTAKQFYEEFEPLSILAVEVGHSSISHNGLGRKDAIDFELASRPTNVPSAVGIIQSQTKKEKKSKEKEDSKK